MWLGRRCSPDLAAWWVRAAEAEKPWLWVLWMARYEWGWVLGRMGRVAHVGFKVVAPSREGGTSGLDCGLTETCPIR